MNGIDPKSARYAIGNIDDGNIFENFAKDFLSKLLGYEFVPVGGLHDKGIDGFEHTFTRTDNQKTIYQFSIQKTYQRKITDSLDKLKRNSIRYEQFVFVTNRNVANIDKYKDNLIDTYGKAINIFDLEWFAIHINDSENTVRSYQIFVDTHLHQFNRPGQSFQIANLLEDARLYTYLRQKVDELHERLKLDQIVVDTLIMYALEDTDPEKAIYLTRDQILERINTLVRFDAHQIATLLDKRLAALSKKPRRINYHKPANGYCLQYNERTHIQNDNLNDLAVFAEYQSDTRNLIDSIVSPQLSSIVDFQRLVDDLLNTLYYKQGIEFSDFVLHGSTTKAFEKNLPDLVSELVDNSKIKHKFTEIKQCLLAIIRAIVYDGTPSQKSFLRRLSQTYSILFLLQCDPRLCTYFSALASKLNIYVCTSIIIPALSERFLEPQNRRYTNLLSNAQKAGVKLCINEPILRELVGHFKMIRQIYEEIYQGNDNIYCTQAAMLTIPEIMIRAYYHALNRNQVNHFKQFISTFVSPTMDRLPEDLVSWLSNEFGIKYQPNSSLGINLDDSEVERISSKLSSYKLGDAKATKLKSTTDAQVILTIFAIRERNNEISTSGISGYKTWWLTSDVTTQIAAAEVSGNKYSVSCYMRPDFLHNYISLAPTKGEIDDVFTRFFPTLLGVNLSTFLPENVSQVIHNYIKEHKEQSESRKISIINELIDDLKQNPQHQNVQYVRNRTRNLHPRHGKAPHF
jgi:hypothetical protein